MTLEDALVLWYLVASAEGYDGAPNREERRQKICSAEPCEACDTMKCGDLNGDGGREECVNGFGAWFWGEARCACGVWAADRDGSLMVDAMDCTSDGDCL